MGAKRYICLVPGRSADTLRTTPCGAFAISCSYDERVSHLPAHFLSVKSCGRHDEYRLEQEHNFIPDCFGDAWSLNLLFQDLEAQFFHFVSLLVPPTLVGGTRAFRLRVTRRGK